MSAKDLEALRAERSKRIETAISLQEADRVPFIPKTSGIFMLGYGISFYDAMKDARLMIPGFQKFMADYEPDAVNIGGLYGIDSLEALGTQYLRWPGPECGLPLDSSFQHLDGEYFHDDEWDEFLEDPTHMMITKLIPRRHKELAGLSKLYAREVYDAGWFANLTTFADPEVKQALDALEKAGEAGAKRGAQMAALRAAINEDGFDTWCQGTFFIPYDAFADSLRGILRISMDVIEFPGELHAVIDRITQMNVGRLVERYAAAGAKRVFIPLHCGVDEFMSPEAYDEFYWPNLKYCINTVINNGMTPVCFCEGNYDSRLETLMDVPKGKVVYAFEKVNLQRAKDTVGQVACICGTMPNALLAFGTPEQIVAETKHQIDILAPGGGFIMDCSIMLDNAKHENLKAWRDTTLEYGVY